MIALELEHCDRPAHCQYVNAPEQFGLIHTSGVNLVVWPRANRTDWQPLLRRLIRERIHVVATLDLADVEWLLLTELARLGETEADGIELIRDIQRLARAFTGLCGDQQLTMRLEVINSDECRLFHVDRRRLRLLCTYAGPGMEWLENNRVDRTALGQGSNKRVQAGARPRQLAAGHVAVLKGELYPGNAGSGIVHRSPYLSGSGSHRLRLRFDQPLQG